MESRNGNLKYVMLAKVERKILKSFAEASLPGSKNLPISTNQIKGFYEDVEKFLEKLPSYISWTIRFMLIVIQISPVLFFIPPFRRGFPTVFTRLSREERTLYLEKWNKSSLFLLRASPTLLKLPIVLAFGAREEVRDAIGYHVECGDVEKNPTPELVEENVLEFERSRKKIFEIDCDILIVGSGGGGAVTAKELAEKGLNVAVVEEGFKHDSSEFNGKPSDMVPLLYRNSGVTATFHPTSPPIFLPLGKCLGGTTVINSGTCFRTPDFVLEGWTRMGLDGMAPEDMSTYFNRVERTLSIHPISLNLMGEANARIMEGTEFLGYEGLPLNKSASGCRGTGVCQYGCPTNAKKAMHITYIPLATQKGAKFYTGFKAKWLVRENEKIKKVGGIIVNRDKKEIGKFVARSNVVVLAAGAIHTLQLLLKNRIANSSGWVGKNLRIHPCGGVIAVFPESIHGWDGSSQSYGVTEFFENGIMIEGAMVPPEVGASMFPIGRDLCRLMGDWRKISAFGPIIADSDSVGRVWRFSIGGMPLVSYRIGERDKRKIVKGIAETSRIALAAGAEKVFTGIFSKPWITEEKKVDELLTLAGQVKKNEIPYSAYHPQGTCRMSQNPKEGVINSHCRSHDIDNLFIVDASIFPSCVQVNPQVSIMAFANRCADYIAETCF